MLLCDGRENEGRKKNSATSKRPGRMRDSRLSGTYNTDLEVAFSWAMN